MSTLTSDIKIQFIHDVLGLLGENPVGKGLAIGCVSEVDEKRSYWTWDINGCRSYPLTNEKEPPWLQKILYPKKRKHGNVFSSALDGRYWRDQVLMSTTYPIRMKRPLTRRPPPLPLSMLSPQPSQPNLEILQQQYDTLLRQTKSLLGHIVRSLPVRSPLRSTIIGSIPHYIPEVNAKDLGISARTYRRHWARYSGRILPILERRTRRPKIWKYRAKIMAYLDTIMPIKSGSDYRLQYVTDRCLWKMIQHHMINEYGFRASCASYRRFIKKNTRRSHVTKLDGCYKCHSLQFNANGLTDHQKAEYMAHRALALQQKEFQMTLLNAVADETIPNAIIVSMDFSKFDLSAKCESVECHIIVLRYGPTLAKKVVPIIGESQPINGLFRTYVNIFGVTSESKHNPDFVYHSWQKVITKFLDLFQACQSVFFFCDGGSHHYKSRHGFYAFATIAKELRSIMRGGSNLFPDVSFHFHASYHGSDICDCVASIDKKAIKRFSVGERKWIKDGHGFVEALGTLPSNFYSDDIENTVPPIMRCKKKLTGSDQSIVLKFGRMGTILFGICGERVPIDGRSSERMKRTRDGFEKGNGIRKMRNRSFPSRIHSKMCEKSRIRVLLLTSSPLPPWFRKVFSNKFSFFIIK